MIPRSSVKKLFFYLTGLVVACFLHFSCQVVTDRLGIKDLVQALLSRSDGTKSSISPRMTQLIKHNLGLAGKGKNDDYDDDDYDDGYDDNITMEHGFGQLFGDDFIGVRIVKDANGIEKKVLAMVCDGNGKHWQSADLAKEMTKIYLLSTRVSPKEKIEDAYDQTEKFENFKNGGAITVYGVSIDTDSGIASFATMGDGQAAVLRNKNGEWVYEYKSPKREHRHNHPWYLAHTRNKCEDEKEKKGPIDCDEKNVKLQSKDILYIITDGIGDNFRDKEIFNLINKSLSNGESAQEMAESFVKELNEIIKGRTKSTCYKQELIQELAKGNKKVNPTLQFHAKNIHNQLVKEQVTELLNSLYSKELQYPEKLKIIEELNNIEEFKVHKKDDMAIFIYIHP